MRAVVGAVVVRNEEPMEGEGEGEGEAGEAEAEAEESEKQRGICAPRSIGSFLREVREGSERRVESSYTIVCRRSAHGGEGDERICSDG